MRPLYLLLGLFLRLIVSDLLWGCEPGCIKGTAISFAKNAQVNTSWFVAGVDNQGGPVVVQDLAGSLMESDGKYGVMILESGANSAIQWRFTSPSQDLASSGLGSSKLSSDSFTEISPAVCSIDAAKYSRSPNGLVLASPKSSISFRIEPSKTIDCTVDGLFFAIISWDHTLESHLNEDITFIVTSQCTYCPGRSLSDRFVRICPIGQGEGTTVRETLPTRSPTEATSTPAMSPTETLTTTVEVATAAVTTKSLTPTAVTTTKTASITTVTPTTTEAITPKTIAEVTTTKTEAATTTVEIPTAATTTSTAKSTTSTTGSPVSIYKTTFNDDLKGLRVVYASAPKGVTECHDILTDFSLFGSQLTCTGDGNGVDIAFGTDATVKPGDLVKLRTESGTLELPVSVSGSMVRPEFVLDYKKVVMKCENQMEFKVKQVAGTGGRDASFEWKQVEGTDVSSLLQAAKNKRLLILPVNKNDQKMTINLTVCNFGGECTTSDPLTVDIIDSTESLTVAIEGVPPVVYPSMALKLAAVAKFSSCREVIDARETIYNWTVNGSTSYDSSNRILAFSHSVNQIIPVHLQASYEDPKTEKLYLAEAETKITYTAEPLILTIDAARRTHPADAVLFIDASASRDPNSAHSVLIHSWTCTLPNSNHSCNLPRGTNYNSPFFELPSATLESGEDYLFTDQIASSLGQSGSVSSLVTVSAVLLPSVVLVPMVYQKQSIHDYIRLLALISSEESPTNATWEVLQSPGYDYFDLQDFLPNNKIDFNVKADGRKTLVSLTIPPKDGTWAGLAPNSRYPVKISATNSQGMSSAEVVLETLAELPQGKVEVLPTENLTGLFTEITFRLGDGWSSQDLPINYRFGYRILQQDNESTVEWLPHTASSSVEILLPSGGPGEKFCNRTGFTAMVEACDRTGACRVTETEEFHLAAPDNLTLAIKEAAARINTDIVNGNLLNSMQKIWAVEQELCQAGIDESVADKSTLALLRGLSSESGIDEWKEKFDAATHVLPSVSDEALLEIQPILQDYRIKMGFSTVIRQKRGRRDTSMVALANNTVTSENEASDMLELYDLLLLRNQRVMDTYLANINDFLSAFCTQLDDQSTRILKAKGNDYIQIQAQAVNPNNANFLNSTLATAGSTAYIAFTDIFQSLYKSWSCSSELYCNYACLASAKLLSKVFALNGQLVEIFYPDKAPTDANRSVSDLYKVSILNPINGKAAVMMPVPLYSIRIPITDYKSVNYYACFIYTDAGQAWDATSCTTTPYASKQSGTNYMTCNCTTSGYIGVYTTSAPTPPPQVPLHNDIRLTFELNSTSSPTAGQILTFVTNLGAAGQSSRLVNWKFGVNNDSQAEISVTLRPPFKTTQITSAYALQAILRVVNPLSGFVAYDQVKILGTVYEVITRALVGDGNARKMIVRIDKSYTLVVGNNSEPLATKWTDSIATALRMSSYRFKNPQIFMGIIFNFTITKPFEEEKSASSVVLSAEEISLMLLESTSYSELSVTSNSGEFITLPEISANRDIVELRVIQQYNSLVIVLLVSVLSGVMIMSLYIGGAVVVKVRTDRCLEDERRRVVMRDTAEISAPPQYGEAVPDGVIRSRHR